MKIFDRVVWLSVCFAALVFAQLDRGTITGKINDPAGAVVPGSKVTVQNTATGARYDTTSNDAGQYTMPNLPPGPYQVIVENASFKKLTRSGITLNVADVVRVDIQLELGSVTESVQVTAEQARLETDTRAVATTLQNRNILDLPLNFGEARSAETFAFRLAPGVSGDSWVSSVNGSASFSKETLLEGAPVSTNYPGTFVFSNPSVEAIQEFKVQTGGLSAEYGRTQGGVFNYALKSGTNQLHGSAFGSLRNEAFNANTFANKFRGAPRAIDRKTDYAGSFGGPVVIPKLYNGKNKTFFYTAYERFRERSLGFGAPNRTVPLPEFYDGDLSRLLGPAIPQTDALGRQVLRGAVYDPASFSQMANGRWIGDMFPGNRIPASRFSAVSRNVNAIAKEHYLPTVRDASGQIPLINNSLFPAIVIPVFDQYQYSVKGDQIINDAHKLSATYSYTYRPRLLADGGGPWEVGDPTGGPLSNSRWQRQKTQIGRLSHDWTISPRLLNHLTLFFNRLANPSATVQQDIDGSKQIGIKNFSTYGYPTINWGGGPFVNIDTIGGPTNGFISHQGFGLINTFNFSKGRHFMRAGIDIRRNHLNSRPTDGGTFNFNARGTAIPNEPFAGTQIGHAFASYLLGIVDNGARGDSVPIGTRRNYYGLFFQDDFKVTSRLTLQLGLRWEHQPPFTEVADRLSSWNPNKIDPESGLPGAYDFAGNCSVCTGGHYFGQNSYRDFGPRFGFAWRATDKWVIRGGYGIMFPPDLFNSTSVLPLGKANSVAWGGTYSLNADPVLPARGIFNWDSGFPLDRFAPGTFDVSWGNRNQPGMMDPNYGRSGYSQEWNLNIQRELARNLVLDVGYVGNKSTGLYEGELQRINQIPASALSQYGAGLNNAVTSAAQAAANGVRLPFASFRGTVASALRQYPQVQGNQFVRVYGAPLGFSTYHGLQVTVNRQFSKGFTAFGNYVWSKTLSNIETFNVGTNAGRPLDYYNLKLEKAIAQSDIPHMVKGFVEYELPTGRGKPLLAGAGRVVNTLVGGWAVSAVLNYFSGQPLGFGGSLPLAGGWNGAANRANVAAGDLRVSGFDKSNFELSNTSASVNTYLSKGKFADPPALTLGTGAVRYAQVRGFGTMNEDFGLRKNTMIKERFRFQLRADFLNAFNRHQLGGINTAITSPLFGQVTSVGGSRVIQLGTRLDF